MDKDISVFYVKNWQRRGTSAFFHNDEKSMMKILLYPYDNENIDFVARGLEFFQTIIFVETFCGCTNYSQVISSWYITVLRFLIINSYLPGFILSIE